MFPPCNVFLPGILLWITLLHSGTFSLIAGPPILEKNTDHGKPIFFHSKEFFDPEPQEKIRLTEKDLNKSVNFAIGIVNKLERFELSLGWSNIHVVNGSSSHGQIIDSKPEIEAVRQGRNALVTAKATLHLIHVHCEKHSLGLDECMKQISELNLLSTALGGSCPNRHPRCTEEDFLSKYRSLDGSCNHIYNGLWGKSYTGYKRMLPANYFDGVQEIRKSIERKFDLPSPRTISTSLYTQRDVADSEITLSVMQWGQFIEHDLAHTPSNKMMYLDNTIECCDGEGRYLSPRYVHPFCSSISIPEDDVFYSKYRIQCMPYVRSIAAMRIDCTLGPLDQINQATHFLDGSQIYGSDIRKIMQLRKFHRGLLKTTSIHKKNLLPLTPTPTEHCQNDNPKLPCFLSGDSRVNAQPQLTALQTLLHREHNRIATALAMLNPPWDDETLYQEARRIVVAEIQHITYNEWLPIVLSKRNVGKINTKNASYSAFIDPRVSNSFATAAIRAINSLVADNVSLYTKNRKVKATINLREHFNKPKIMVDTGNLDGLIRGLATQNSQQLDMNYAEDITTQLYQNGKYGLDIVSLDIQRGRDHGLPSYTAFRAFCGLPDVVEFKQLTHVMSVESIEGLMKVFRNVQDIDLLVGGLSEKPENDSLFGPTFSCIIADQFLRTKLGDRYFYDSVDQPKPFTKNQLMEIQKTTLARIYCDNGDDIEFMQPNVFRKIGKSNNLVSCISNDISYMDLRHWKVSKESE